MMPRGWLQPADARSPSTQLRFGPWLWSPQIDLLVFAGSALLALALVTLGRWLGFGGGALPEWAWVAFVLLVDVAHVYSTLFRTYLDTDELNRHPFRYTLTPLALYGALVWLHTQGSMPFWRVLAYVALFHFVRQQVGWCALYRARARQGNWDKYVDDVAIYAATLFPVAYWHAHLERAQYSWFVAGDFLSPGPWLTQALPLLEVAWLLALVGFVFRQIYLVRTEGIWHVGKCVVVVTTATAWYVGIVATNSDFDFTVTNVIIHGVPYVALLHAYGKARARQLGGAMAATARASLLVKIMSSRLWVFLVGLAVLAFAEEALWDQLVYHERTWLFGESRFQVSTELLNWVVPLLALPQVTHYVLDGLLWRRRDTEQSRAQQKALGFVRNQA